MRKYNSILPLKWMLSLLLVAGLISCADEDIVSRKVDVVEGINTEVSLLFNSAVPSVQSRGALEIQQEYKVHNLYVFVFNNETGKKEYGHLFELNAENDEDKLLDVEEKKSETGPTTSGSVKMKIPSGEKRIYAVANVPLGDSHASLMKDLDDIESITDLENNVVLSSKTVARGTGKLVMSGWLKTASQRESDPEGYCIISPTNENSLSAIKLVRVDARVTFNVSLDKEEGDKERDETIIERRFTPNKYLVKNVPTKAYLYSKDDNVLVEDADYFSSNSGQFENFEIVENGVSSFTFYMMENKQTATGLEKYEQREEEYKKSTGENEGYKFAPSTATLVEITGYYFEKYVDRDGLTKERHADVKYTIHLGYVDGDPNDFRCKRNTTYIYNVYVQSVNKIRLEVTSYNDGEGTTVEEQPGAEGNIVETDKYYQFDSHYDRMLVTFNKRNIAGRAGFRVKTPFDDGYYCIKEEEGITNAKPLSEAKDYKWIKFRRHKRKRYDNKYYDKENYADFDPREIITIDQLLKELHTKEESTDDNSIYDSNGDAVYTMFIDEYYYPCDPRDGHYGEYSDGRLTDDATAEEGTDFWKNFVNQPNREIHILCNTQYSQDKESSLTTSAVMVSQRSIKTFYNEQSRELKTAWGLETINETGLIEPEDGNNPWSTGNSSKNGLWNFFEQTNDFKGYRGSSRWTTYISGKVKEDENGTHDYMNVTKSKKLLYACLQRNRDENGDGYIDETEVKWYPASINQYTDIWIGTPALPAETYLYSNVAATEQGYRRYLSSDGKEFYAEEGSSIGGFKFQYANSITGKPAPTKYDYRCLRNLGKRDGKPASADDMPQHYVSTSWDSEKVTLSLSFINSAALRTDEEYLKGEITTHDENSNLNRPYLKFEFKTVFVGDDKSWNGINSRIDADTKNSPCAQFNINLPAGEPKWRLPNQRELSLMTSNYDSWGGRLYVQSRTGSSLPEKKNNNIGYSGGWNDGKPFISLADNNYTGPVRCVRDVK